MPEETPTDGSDDDSITDDLNAGDSNADDSNEGGGGLSNLNVLSLLGQAGYALYRGNRRRAGILFGTAVISTRFKKTSYLIQAALTGNDIRKRFFGPKHD